MAQQNDRILIVDDVAANLDYYAIEMIQAGYEVATADNSILAMSLLDQGEYSLVITDLKMSDFDGLEILKKAKEKNQYCEVVLITGRGSEEDAVQALREGAFDYLRKPLDRAELLVKVGRAMERGHSRRAQAEYEVERENLIARRTAELEASRKEYQNLFENLSEGIYRTDEEGTIVLCNNHFARLFGYQDAAEIVGMNVRDFYFNQGERDYLLTRLDEEGLVQDFIEKVRKKDGSAIVVSVNASIIHYDPSKSGWIEGSVSDVTAQKTNEEIWRLSHQLSSDAIYVVGPDKRFRYLNKAVCAVLEYDEDELLGQSYELVVHPDDEPTVTAELRRKMTEHDLISQYKFRVRTKNGSQKWIKIESKYCEYQGEACVIGFGRDISTSMQEEDLKEKHRLELERLVKERTHQLERERNNYNAILDGLEEPVNIISQNSIVKYQNKKSLDLYGDGVGKTCQAVFKCDNIYKEKCCLDKNFPSEPGGTYDERSYEGGKIFRYGSRLFQDLDEEYSILEIGMDITELRKAEIKFRQTEKLATLGQLAAKMSHDIKQPLDKIGICVPIIRNALAGTSSEKSEFIHDKLDEINHALGRAKKIIDRFRGFSPSRESAPQCFNLNDIAKHALLFYEDHFKASKISIDLHFADPLPVIYGMTDRVENALINLLENAYKAINEKADLFDKIGEERKITLHTTYEKKEKKILLRITDNGIGIAKDIQDKIFQPFFTTKTDETSQGLGLFIISEIVNEQKGEIGFESSAGWGTTFWLKFPAHYTGDN